MPKKVYPCTQSGCLARYDPELDGKIEGTGGILTGWEWPLDPPEANDVPVHDHVLNILVFREVPSE